MMDYNEISQSASGDPDPGEETRPGRSSGTAAWIHAAAQITLDGPAGRFDLDVSVEIGKAMFVALVGPSGAGKTTLLRILAGLTKPDRGYVRVGEAIWCDTAAGPTVPVRHRSIGFVFQDYALFPNMTVRRNVEYAIGRNHDAGEVGRLLELVGLERLRDAYPARLSGGQKQRLALIRALARKPDVLMLDEPLSALDPDMRRQLQDELKRLHRAFGTTTVMVSHDITEILRLADRVIRLENGRIVADGDPSLVFTGKETRGATVLGHHVSGPDEDGVAVVSVDGRICRIRYREAPPDLTAGDPVVLDITEALASRADKLGPEVHAGDIVTFTSRGGA